jgi:CelD/BcsL family acetyltransferase involved in cellulose biosynthesis
MSDERHLQLIRIPSREALLDHAEAWDDLWRRSEVSTPSACARLLALWLETFAPDRRFLALAVAREGQLVAALPLVGRRLKGVLELAGMPSNQWADCGEFLLDPAGDVDAVVAFLAAALRRIHWPLL